MAFILIKKNMGRIDQVIRITTGALMMYFGFVAQDVIGNLTINIIVGIFGFISIFFALFSYCPIYLLGDISTAKQPSAKD